MRRQADMKGMTAIPGFCLLLLIMLAGSARSPSSVQPAVRLDRESRMRDMVKELALTREQRQELQKELRAINARFDALAQIESDRERSLQELKRKLLSRNSEVSRRDVCPGGCPQSAKTYNAKAAKLQAAQQQFDRTLKESFEIVNRDLSPRQSRLMYAFVDDELSRISLRRNGVVSRHVAPKIDADNPPYAKSRLPNRPPKEASARESTRVPNLKGPQQKFVLVPGVAIQKLPTKPSRREVPAGLVSLEMMNNLFEGVPAHTSVTFLKDLFSISDKILAELQAQ
jgi:hypothetical protein